jgi:DNA-binding CsgD family transcriptional regulator
VPSAPKTIKVGMLCTRSRAGVVGWHPLCTWRTSRGWTGTAGPCPAAGPSQANQPDCWLGKALLHESRAIAADYLVVGGVMLVALQGGDVELLHMAAENVSSELRDLPGAEWLVHLLDEACTLIEPGRSTSTLAVPPPLMPVLLLSDLVVRVLLSDGRLDDALSWAEQVPPSWPAAHTSASLARAWIAERHGDPAAADQIHDALTEAASLGLMPFVTEALELLALHLTEGTHYDHAARLLGAADTARARMGTRWRYPYHQAGVDESRRRGLESLGARSFGTLYDEGSGMSLDATILFAQRMRGKRSRPSQGWAALTPTEITVAEEIAAGSTNTEAAANLFIAPSTVKTHLERIYGKLGIHGRAALATEVARHIKP